MRHGSQEHFWVTPQEVSRSRNASARKLSSRAANIEISSKHLWFSLSFPTETPTRPRELSRAHVVGVRSRLGCAETGSLEWTEDARWWHFLSCGEEASQTFGISYEAGKSPKCRPGKRLPGCVQSYSCSSRVEAAGVEACELQGREGLPRVPGTRNVISSRSLAGNGKASPGSCRCGRCSRPRRPALWPREAGPWVSTLCELRPEDSLRADMDAGVLRSSRESVSSRILSMH